MIDRKISSIAKSQFSLRSLFIVVLVSGLLTLPCYELIKVLSESLKTKSELPTIGYTTLEYSGLSVPDGGFVVFGGSIKQDTLTPEQRRKYERSVSSFDTQ